MSDILDKLAMEVSEWTPTGFHKAGLKNDDYEMLADYILEEKWLKRRVELINEPSDADAPEWAKWKAQDSCGKWFWYKEMPTLGASMWTDEEDGWQGSNNGDIPAGHDWKKTLKEVNQMDNLKEVKLTWAYGGIVQYYCGIDEAWKDWGQSGSLNTNWYSKWRVKPKPKTHSQWERKFYCPNSKAVITAYNTEDDQFPNDKMWVTEPELHTYEIED